MSLTMFPYGAAMSISPLSNNSNAAMAYGYGSSTVGPMTQAVLDAAAKAAEAGTSLPVTSTSDGVSISTDAKIAAAEAADKVKDFNALTTEVRKSLDDGSADMTEMSGRALSAVVLDRSGNFSRGEIDAAKQELAGRSREDFTSLIGGAGTLGGLSAYNQQLVSQYDAMSDEEREARDWTPAIRNSAAAFVQGSQTMTSLFDQLNQDDGTSDSSNPSLFDLG